jgi:hypothetical protein
MTIADLTREIADLRVAFRTELDSLLNDNFELRNRIIFLEHQAVLAPTPAQPLPPSRDETPAREYRMNPPPSFGGKMEDTFTFLSQVDLFFRAQPRTFSSDDSRISLFGSLLQGPALAWMLTFPGLMDGGDYSAFRGEFEDFFTDPFRKPKAQTALSELRQGDDSFTTYLSTFLTHVGPSGHADDTLKSLLLEGMRPELAATMATVPDPDSFSALVKAVRKVAYQTEEARRKASLRGKTLWCGWCRTGGHLEGQCWRKAENRKGMGKSAGNV